VHSTTWREIARVVTERNQDFSSVVREARKDIKLFVLNELRDVEAALRQCSANEYLFADIRYCGLSRGKYFTPRRKQQLVSLTV